MIKCVVIDDEPDAIKILTTYIAQTPELLLIHHSTKALDTITYLMENEVHVIFLDVNMPQISGIEFIQVTKRINPEIQIILTTGYSEYAIQAFDNQVVDYLLKPISFQRFLQAVQRVNYFMSKIHHGTNPRERQFFFVKVDTKNKAVKVAFDDILYIEGLKNYISIYTDFERIVTLLNMKDLEDLLPREQFQRVHRSYIIPVNRIKYVDGNMIHLSAGSGIIPIGSTYRESFMRFMHNNGVS